MRNLVQVADLSIKDVTERDEWGDVSVMNSGRENRISSPLGFLRSASSMVNLSLKWYACVLSPFFDHLILRDKALSFVFCSAKLTSVASLDIANLAGTLTKLQITRCPKLRNVARLTGLKRLVELGIYECPAAAATDPSVDRPESRDASSSGLPLRSLLLNSYTPVDDGDLEGCGLHCLVADF